MIIAKTVNTIVFCQFSLRFSLPPVGANRKIQDQQVSVVDNAH